jgi:hypothetical protein
MPFQYKNPLTSQQLSTPESTVRTLVQGTNFSVLNVGGYMEVYNLSDLGLSFVGTGLQQLSGNTIPIQITIGTGAAWSPSVLTLNSDNVSSGRRRLGMLVYVYETDTVYQYYIPDYETLWSGLLALTGSSGITQGDYTTTVNTRSQAGRDFIESWTGSTIEGVDSVTRENARWRVFQVTSGTAGTAGTSGTSGINANYVGQSNDCISLSGLTVGNNITFITSNDLSYTTAQDVLVAYDTDDYFIGKVVSYNATNGTLILKVTSVSGTATYCDWDTNLNGVSSGSSGTSGNSGTSGTSGTSGSGSSGTSGTNGSSGTSGTSGSTGTSGTSGSGSSGTSGTSGSGSSGTSGTSGSGSSGTSGTNGSSGTSGTSGSGSSGTSGTNGSSGTSGTSGSGSSGTSGTSGSGSSGTSGTSGSGSSGTSGTSGSGSSGTSGTSGSGSSGTSGTSGSGSSGTSGTSGSGSSGTSGTSGSGSSGTSGTSISIDGTQDFVLKYDTTNIIQTGSIKDSGVSGNVNISILSNGNVGIKKQSPNTVFDVNGNALISGSLVIAPTNVIELKVTNAGVDIGNLKSDKHTLTGSLNIPYTSSGVIILDDPTSGSVYNDADNYIQPQIRIKGTTGVAEQTGISLLKNTQLHLVSNGKGAFATLTVGSNTRAYLPSDGWLQWSESETNTVTEPVTTIRRIGSGRLEITSSVRAQSFTSSLASGVGFLGTASFALTSSYPFYYNGTTIYDTITSKTNFNNNNSFFVGYNAGDGSQYASYSNFIGYTAGVSSDGGFNSNFLGRNAGGNTGDVQNSNFIGTNAGASSQNIINSNYIGVSSGISSINSDDSNFIGLSAGQNSQYVSRSTFIGFSSGKDSYGVNQSTFIGNESGIYIRVMTGSILIGEKSGHQATQSSFTNFIGYQAGYNSKNVISSSFIGANAGLFTSNSAYVNIIGSDAGTDAHGLQSANIIGNAAGHKATGASYSNLIGFNVGSNRIIGLNGIGQNNIIIGTNITLDEGRKDSINIGGLIFGTGSYASTSGNPHSGSSDGRVGINVRIPTNTLHVSSSVDPIRVQGIQTSTDTYYLTIDDNGVVHKTLSSGSGSSGTSGTSGSGSSGTSGTSGSGS